MSYHSITAKFAWFIPRHVLLMFCSHRCCEPLAVNGVLPNSLFYIAWRSSHHGSQPTLQCCQHLWVPHQLTGDLCGGRPIARCCPKTSQNVRSQIKGLQGWDRWNKIRIAISFHLMPSSTYCIFFPLSIYVSHHLRYFAYFMHSCRVLAQYT